VYVGWGPQEKDVWTEGWVLTKVTCIITFDYIGLKRVTEVILLNRKETTPTSQPSLRTQGLALSSTPCTVLTWKGHRVSVLIYIPEEFVFSVSGGWVHFIIVVHLTQSMVKSWQKIMFFHFYSPVLV
jgi:hypothetical protein